MNKAGGCAARQKAKGKRQKWRMNHGASLLVGKAAGILFLPFAFCLLPCGAAARLSPEVTDGYFVARLTLWFSDAGEESRLHCGCGADAGAWARGEHGNLLADRPDSHQAVAS